MWGPGNLSRHLDADESPRWNIMKGFRPAWDIGEADGYRGSSTLHSIPVIQRMQTSHFFLSSLQGTTERCSEVSQETERNVCNWAVAGNNILPETNTCLRNTAKTKIPEGTNCARLDQWHHRHHFHHHPHYFPIVWNTSRREIISIVYAQL